MQKIESYKVVWNAACDEGTLLLKIKTGIVQIYMDNAMEGLLMLKTLRETNPVFVQDGVIFTGFEDVDEKHHEILQQQKKGAVEEQKVHYDLVSHVISPKKKRPKSSSSTQKATSNKTNTKVKLVPKSTQKATAKAEVKVTSKSKPKSKKKANPKTKATKDNLRLIEGIGPKIEQLLHKDGITTFQILSKTKQAKLKSVLAAAGSRYSFHDPSTWPKQASLAAKGKMVNLKKWQDELKGGKKK